MAGPPPHAARVAVSRNGDVAIARCALARAIVFLRAQSGAQWLDRPASGADRAIQYRVLANWLRELDRLHAVLLDTVDPKQRGGQPGATLVKAGESQGPTDLRRAQGLRRAYGAFRYTGGAALCPDVRGGATATMGWLTPDGTLERVAIGAPIPFGRDTLLDVCGFYESRARAAVANECG